MCSSVNFILIHFQCSRAGHGLKLIECSQQRKLNIEHKINRLNPDPSGHRLSV